MGAGTCQQGTPEGLALSRGLLSQPGISGRSPREKSDSGKGVPGRGRAGARFWRAGGKSVLKERPGRLGRRCGRGGGRMQGRKVCWGLVVMDGYTLPFTSVSLFQSNCWCPVAGTMCHSEGSKHLSSETCHRNMGASWSQTVQRFLESSRWRGWGRSTLSPPLPQVSVLPFPDHKCKSQGKAHP